MPEVYVYFEPPGTGVESARQREVADDVLVDYDATGRQLGVEVIGACHVTIDGVDALPSVPVESGDTTSYREKVAVELWRQDYGPGVPFPADGRRRSLYLAKADAVLAVQDAEMERLRHGFQDAWAERNAARDEVAEVRATLTRVHDAATYDDVTNVQAVEMLAAQRDSDKNARSRCHARHMSAERELADLRTNGCGMTECGMRNDSRPTPRASRTSQADHRRQHAIAQSDAPRDRDEHR